MKRYWILMNENDVIDISVATNTIKLNSSDVAETITLTQDSYSIVELIDHIRNQKTSKLLDVGIGRYRDSINKEFIVLYTTDDVFSIEGSFLDVAVIESIDSADTVESANVGVTIHLSSNANKVEIERNPKWLLTKQSIGVWKEVRDNKELTTESELTEIDGALTISDITNPNSVATYSVTQMEDEAVLSTNTIKKKSSNVLVSSDLYTDNDFNFVRISPDGKTIFYMNQTLEYTDIGYLKNSNPSKTTTLSNFTEAKRTSVSGFAPNKKDGKNRLWYLTKSNYLNIVNEEGESLNNLPVLPSNERQIINNWNTAKHNFVMDSNLDSVLYRNATGDYIYSGSETAIPTLNTLLKNMEAQSSYMSLVALEGNKLVLFQTKTGTTKTLVIMVDITTGENQAVDEYIKIIKSHDVFVSNRTVNKYVTSAKLNEYEGVVMLNIDWEQEVVDLVAYNLPTITDSRWRKFMSYGFIDDDKLITLSANAYEGIAGINSAEVDMIKWEDRIDYPKKRKILNMPKDIVSMDVTPEGFIAYKQIRGDIKIEKLL